MAVDFAPAALAGHNDSDTVLATTPEGVRRSTDGGNTWTLDTSSPLIQVATFAHPKEAACVEPDVTVHYSADAGATWTRMDLGSHTRRDHRLHQRRHHVPAVRRILTSIPDASS